MATSWTQAHIDALEAIVGSGVLTVKYGGPPQRETTYQSTEAMEAALARMKRAVHGATAYRLVQHTKGFR